MKEFTTSRGITIRFVGIAQLLDVLNGQFKPPEPPTYSRQSLAGLQTFPHNETTLDDPEGDEEKTKANHTAWDAYQKELKRVTREHEEALTKLCLLRGIQFEMPSDDTWMQEQRVIGFKIPDDLAERRLHYITTEVVPLADDVKQAVYGVMEASDVPEDKLAELANLFWGPMGKPNGHETSRPANGANGQRMELQQPIRASVSSLPHGKVSKRVRQRKSRGQSVRDTGIPHGA